MLLLTIGLESLQIQLISQPHSGCYFSLLETIQMSFKLTLEDLSIVPYTINASYLFRNFKTKLLSYFCLEWLKTQPYNS